MSRFAQVYEPIDEGWAIALMKVASFVLPRPVNFVKGIASNVILKKLLNEPGVKSYLKTQCDELLKSEQKKDPTITYKLPSDPITMVKRWWHNNDGIGTFSKTGLTSDSNNLLDDKIFKLNVNQYNVTFFYDTDHIDAAVVLFYSKKYDKCIGKRIKPPKEGEMAKTFKHEK